MMNAMGDSGVESGGSQWGEVFSGGVFSGGVFSGGVFSGGVFSGGVFRFQFSVFRGFATALKTENFLTSSLLHERGEVVE
jgi:hypothetical protein